MKWINLKTRKCPKCEKLIRSEGSSLLKCSNIECDFRISEAKRSEILLNMENKVGPGGKRNFEEGYGE